MWQKIRAALSRFMEGRCGADQLSNFCVWAGLFLYILSWITGLGVFSLLGFALYIWSIFRMFSRNRAKRFSENQKYLFLSGKVRTETAQFFRRVKNFRQYKYFRCPKCHARLRLPRKVGSVTVRCGKCGNHFEAKA